MVETRKITAHLDFTKKEERIAFIKENNGILSGKNVDKEDVVVMVEKGVGMTVKTIHTSKPNWYEIVFYDEDGEQTGVTYERI